MWSAFWNRSTVRGWKHRSSDRPTRACETYQQGKQPDCTFHCSFSLRFGFPWERESEREKIIGSSRASTRQPGFGEVDRGHRRRVKVTKGQLLKCYFPDRYGNSVNQWIHCLKGPEWSRGPCYEIRTKWLDGKKTLAREPIQRSQKNVLLAGETIRFWKTCDPKRRRSWQAAAGARRRCQRCVHQIFQGLLRLNRFLRRRHGRGSFMHPGNRLFHHVFKHRYE